MKHLCQIFSACTVQTGIDSFYIFGGAEFLDNKTTAVRNTVLHINTNSLMVKTTGTMKRPRMALGCEVLNKGLILLSGGYSDATNPLQSIEPDEIFMPCPQWRILRVPLVPTCY